MSKPKTVSQKLADNAGLSYFLVVDNSNDICDSTDSLKVAHTSAKGIVDDMKDDGEDGAIGVYELKYIYYLNTKVEAIPFENH